MTKDIKRILNGEDADIGVEYVRFNKINADVYFFVIKTGIQKGERICRLFSTQDQTEWENEELNNFANYNGLECAYIIRDNGNFEDFVYHTDGIKITDIDGITTHRKAWIDRNGYELIFD